MSEDAFLDPETAKVLETLEWVAAKARPRTHSETAPLLPREKFPDLIGKNSSRVGGDELAYPRRGSRPNFPPMFSPRPKSLQCVPYTSNS